MSIKTFRLKDDGVKLRLEEYLAKKEFLTEGLKLLLNSKDVQLDQDNGELVPCFDEVELSRRNLALRRK